MSRFYNLKVSKVEQDTDDALTIAVEIPDHLREEFKFKQGQYINLKKTIDGKDEIRSYSIVNAPGENQNHIEVLVKIIPEGKLSPVLQQNLKAGDMIEVMPPIGSFYANLHPTNDRTYIGLAAGSGISPVLCNIKEILIQEPQSRVYLFFGNKTKDKILKKNEIDRLEKEYGSRFRVAYIVSREKSDNPVFEGRITAEKLNELFDLFGDIPISETTYFICGPTDMIQSIADFLHLEKKVPAIQILHEYYTAPDDDDDPEKSDEFKALPNINSMVTVILDDDEYTFELNSKEEVIVDKCNNEGIPAPYSCHGGVCRTCMAQVLDGEVFMEKNFALNEEQVEQGFILTCQAHPTTHNVTLTFDV